MVEEILCAPRTFEYVRPRRGGAKKFTEPMKRKFPRNYSLRTSGEREGGGERRERGKKKKSRISNSTPKAEFLNERGANNARVFASSHLRLNEKEREDYENLGIWNVVGSRIQKAGGNYYHERDARTNLGGRENGDGGKGKRGRKRAERWGNGQVLLNENNSPLSSRREESVSPGHGYSRRKLDRHTPNERAGRKEDKRRPRGMQVGAKLT